MLKALRIYSGERPLRSCIVVSFGGIALAYIFGMAFELVSKLVFSSLSDSFGNIGEVIVGAAFIVMLITLFFDCAFGKQHAERDDRSGGYKYFHTLPDSFGLFRRAALSSTGFAVCTVGIQALVYTAIDLVFDGFGLKPKIALCMFFMCIIFYALNMLCSLIRNKYARNILSATPFIIEGATVTAMSKWVELIIGQVNYIGIAAALLLFISLPVYINVMKKRWKNDES